MPVSVKSWMLRIAAPMPGERSMATIWQSACGIGLPIARGAAATAAYPWRLPASSPRDVDFRLVLNLFVSYFTKRRRRMKLTLSLFYMERRRMSAFDPPW